jgi:hypothetical protein
MSRNMLDTLGTLEEMIDSIPMTLETKKKMKKTEINRKTKVKLKSKS